MQIASMSGRSSRSTLIAHELLVHQRRDLGILEGLALHHVAPVAGRVADRDEQRPVLVARPGRAPPRPTDTSRPGCPCAGAGTARSRPPRRLGTRLRLPARRQIARQYAVWRSADAESRGGTSCQHTASRSPRPTPRRPSAPTSTPFARAACCSARVRSRSTRKTGELVGATAAEQAGRCLENLAAVCEAAGATPRRRGPADRLPDRHERVRVGQRGLRVVLRVRSAGAGGDRRGGAAARRPGRDRRGGGAPD